MDIVNTSSDQKRSFIKIINIVLIIALLAFGFYLVSKNSNLNQKPDLKSSVVSPDEANTFSNIGKTVIVDIGGAVRNPGVYEMQGNARVIDVIEKAGGLTENVDAKYFDKNINKAQKISDGMKIYIPTVEDLMAAVSRNTHSSQGDTPQDSSGVLGVYTQSGLININTASRKELIDLPGVGEVTADKMISNRPYNSIDELLTKKVVTKSQFDKIKDKITT
jgi:competence protein ComEA